jgi:hypothetical protein
MPSNEIEYVVYQSTKDQTLFCAEIKTIGVLSEEEPVHIALLLDTSGSMEGERMASLKAALKALIRCLYRNDILTIVTYSSDSECICAEKYVGDDPSVWDHLIDGLNANGNTNMGSAFECFVKRCTIPPHAIILMTDGIVNTGALSSRSILLPLDPRSDLRTTPIFTLGIGNGHNQMMLRDIAMSSNGNYFYIDKSEDLPQTFGSILGILRDRCVEAIHIGINLGYTWLERYTPGNKQQIYIPYMPGGIEYRFLFRKTTPTVNDSPYLSVQYKSRTHDSRSSSAMSVGVRLNRLVDGEVFRLEVKDTVNTATGLIAANKNMDAIKLLEGQLARMEEDPDISVMPQVMCLRTVVLDILDSLRKCMSNLPDAPLLSRMTSITTSLSAQRSSTLDSPAMNTLYATEGMRSHSGHVMREYETIVHTSPGV